MVELRDLAYFVAACRCDSLAHAASRLGIGLSTLSTALKALEADLGLSLFRRINSRLYPTASARWLMRIAEPTLAVEAFARRVIVTSRRQHPRVLTVEMDLSFTVGGISAGMQTAIDKMAARKPHVLVDPVWTDSRDTPRVDSLAALLPDVPQGKVTLALADERDRKQRRAITVLADRWVLACRMPAGTRKPPSSADLAAGPIVVPALASQLIEQAEQYLDRLKIRGVRLVNDHPGEVPRLLDEYPDAALLLPESLVSARLGLQRVWAVAVHPPLNTRIVAHTSTQDALGREFVGHLQSALSDRRRPSTSRPSLSMRQIHYFNLLQRVRRVSAAARGVNITQPALSEQLGRLESTLGTQLFMRHGDGLTTTTAGDRFSPFAKVIEASLQRLSDGATAVGAPPSRRIAIGILPSVSQHGLLVNRITDALLQMQERHPALKLVVQEGPNNALRDWVMRGLVGLAIVETSLPHVPRLPLGSSEELAVIVDQKYDLLPAGPVRFADLVHLPLVLPTHRFGLRQLLETAAEHRNMKIQPVIEVDALTMIAAMLARTRLCTVLPPSAVQRELNQGEFAAHPVVEPTIARRLFVIYSGERSLSEPERELVKTLRTRLSQTPEAT
jgi:LysR family transcriptional regulator, nitrogen assimilation regulatory protein